MEPDLASTVAAAKAGSEAAWRLLVETFEASLVRLAWMLTGDRDLAADVAQEAFVEAFVRLRQLREPKAFGGWLRTMAVRIAQRRRERRKWQPEQEIEHRRTPEAELGGAELQQSVDRALAALSPLCREALALAMEGGLTSTEAAALLGCSPEAYRVRLHKARQEMRRRLAPFLEE